MGKAALLVIFTLTHEFSLLIESRFHLVSTYFSTLDRCDAVKQISGIGVSPDGIVNPYGAIPIVSVGVVNRQAKVNYNGVTRPAKVFPARKWNYWLSSHPASVCNYPMKFDLPPGSSLSLM